jgi:hypothetical protein
MRRSDPLNRFEKWSKEMPKAHLGGLIKEYVAESNHNSWDGFSARDLTGVRNFIEDLMRYHDNSDNRDFGTVINNVNPVP